MSNKINYEVLKDMQLGGSVGINRVWPTASTSDSAVSGDAIATSTSESPLTGTTTIVKRDESNKGEAEKVTPLMRKAVIGRRRPPVKAVVNLAVAAKRS